MFRKLCLEKVQKHNLKILEEEFKKKELNVVLVIKENNFGKQARFGVR